MHKPAIFFASCLFLSRFSHTKPALYSLFTFFFLVQCSLTSLPRFQAAGVRNLHRAYINFGASTQLANFPRHISKIFSLGHPPSHRVFENISFSLSYPSNDIILFSSCRGSREIPTNLSAAGSICQALFYILIFGTNVCVCIYES